MAEVIRVGYISSVNYEDGTAQVIYKDRDNSLSPFMPLWSNEFFPPEVDIAFHPHFAVNIQIPGNGQFVAYNVQLLCFLVISQIASITEIFSPDSFYALWRPVPFRIRRNDDHSPCAAVLKVYDATN